MKQDASDNSGSGQRVWRKGERAKVSIFQTFRNAYHEGDARRAQARGGGETEISERSRQRREGVSERTMRDHLEADLNALLNTIQLGSCVDLSDYPHVQGSIANFGFRDLSSVSLAEMNSHSIKDTIRQSLINHEPRLVPESIDVQVTEIEDDVRQRLSISVSAELTGDPVDIPLDFDAEIDVSVGKLRMSHLKVQA